MVSRKRPTVPRTTGPHTNTPKVTARRARTDDGVSAGTSDALRAAMQRLFAGTPHRTDGRLTKDNLWREAQVSRATMNRAKAILQEWDAHIAQHGALTAGEARRDDDIAILRAKLADKTRECTMLGKRLQAAATAIAALYHDNTLLLQELQQAGAVVSLDHRRTR